MIEIKKVIPQDNYTLLVTFSDGKKGLFDVKPYTEKGSLFIELKNTALFKSAKVNYGTVVWANGADLCPDSIYAETKFA